MSEPGRRPGIIERIRSIAPVLALGTVLALLATGVGLAVYADRNNESQRVSELTVEAQTLAATVPAALAFNDEQAAREYVAATRANSDILRAAIYDSRGNLFAGWFRSGAGAPPTKFEQTRPGEHHGLLVVTAPVLQEQMNVGWVYLQGNAEPLSPRLQRYGVIALLAGMAAMVVTVLGVAQQNLARANAQLARQAADLITANQNLRNEIGQREQVEAALRQAQKMEAIGQLTGGVAHDFNNLLQVILGNLERLTRKVRPSAENTEFTRMVGSATRAAERAATLTQRLLAFSRRQPLTPKPIDANKLVTGMLELITRTIGENIQVQTRLAGGLWHCFADENQLENALLNLAVNARDAMPAGGQLTIETANAELEVTQFPPEPEEIRPGEYVMISVIDSGIGMTPDVLAHVFEPFFTTKDIGQGTGLGLSQVYGFVRQSEGHVRIDSVAQQGTSVHLFLPRLATDDDRMAEATSRSEVPLARSPETILLVEDQHDVRTYTAESLRELGYTVIEAAEARSALRLLEQHPEIALLLSDIGLPGGTDGSTLAAEVFRLRPNVRVLLATAYTPSAIVHHGRLGSGIEIVSKPFTLAELAQRVRHALDHHDA